MMPGHDPPSEATPHLAPALTALILGVVALAAMGSYARSLEARSIAGIASAEAVIDPGGDLYRIKNQGTALQRAAFEAGGLLPLYGSSELNMLRPYNRPYHPTNFFRDRPSGFSVLPVGNARAEGGGLPVAFLVLRGAHRLGGRLRRQFLPLACR
jgi:poly-D-alanine transfer protein DltD